MEDGADPKDREPTESDFDRLQDELEDVGSELAALKQIANSLLDAAIRNRTVRLGFDDQEEPEASTA